MEGKNRKTHNLEEIVTRFLPEGTIQAIRRISITEETPSSPGVQLTIRGGVLRVSFSTAIHVGRLAAALGATIAGIWTLVEIIEWATRNLRLPGP